MHQNFSAFQQNFRFVNAIKIETKNTVIQKLRQQNIVTRKLGQQNGVAQEQQNFVAVPTSQFSLCEKRKKTREYRSFVIIIILLLNTLVFVILMKRVYRESEKESGDVIEWGVRVECIFKSGNKFCHLRLSTEARNKNFVRIREFDYYSDYFQW